MARNALDVVSRSQFYDQEASPDYLSLTVAKK